MTKFEYGRMNNTKFEYFTMKNNKVIS